ncbi:Calcium-binding protein (EF-hand domain), partial [Giardia duodenalis]
GDKIVKTADGATSCIDESACSGGFFVETTASGSTSSKVCTACTDENCNVCAEVGEGKCTQCKTTGKMYLKKADGSQTGTCVDEAGCKDGSTHYPDDTGTKTCKACAEGVSNCKTCTKDSGSNTVTCSACLEGFFARARVPAQRVLIATVLCAMVEQISAASVGTSLAWLARCDLDSKRTAMLSRWSP